jgi:hypothetical protein
MAAINGAPIKGINGMPIKGAPRPRPRPRAPRPPPAASAPPRPRPRSWNEGKFVRFWITLIARCLNSVPLKISALSTAEALSNST